MDKSGKENATQLPFDLGANVSYSRADIIESQSNQTAINIIDAWPDWPSSALVLAGPVGSGKTHLANVWLERAQGVIYPISQLNGQMDKIQKSILAGGNLVLEDAGAGEIDDTALFHVLNSIRQASLSCLITSVVWPSKWNIALPDLASRLKAVQVVELQEPDDDLLIQVMLKQFADRQLVVDPKVIEYCVNRMERSLESAAHLVAAIDAEALSRNASITRSTAANALRQLKML